ncbi:dlpC [Symbiodinium sp. KB8]|nr:dlpC [Symbiodinium sp. KB8]
MAGHLVLVEKVKHEHNRPPERGALLQVVLLSSGNSASVVAAIIRVINVALLTQVSRVLLPLAVEGSQAVKGSASRADALAFWKDTPSFDDSCCDPPWKEDINVLKVLSPVEDRILLQSLIINIMLMMNRWLIQMTPPAVCQSFQRVAVELSAKRRRMNIPKLPWETGPMSLIFSRSAFEPAEAEVESLSAVPLRAEGLEVGKGMFLPSMKSDGSGHLAQVAASYKTKGLQSPTLADHPVASLEVGDTGNHGLPAAKTYVQAEGHLSVTAGAQILLMWVAGLLLKLRAHCIAEQTLSLDFWRGRADTRDHSAQVYSRDAVSSSVRVLEEVLASIRSREFVPDSTRSGYFPRADDPRADYDVEGSGSEASLDEADCQDLEKALDEVVDQWAEEAPKRELKAELLVRNRASRMLHLLADESGNVLTCGRMCTKNYDKVAAKPAFMYPMCTRCFSAVQVAEAGDGRCASRGPGRESPIESVGRLAQVSTMSITESEAKFSARAQKLGLKNDAVQLLADGGVNALAKFAYVSSFIPGQSDEVALQPRIELIVWRARFNGTQDDETRNSRDKEDRTLTVDNSGNVRIKNADIKGADLLWSKRDFVIFKSMRSGLIDSCIPGIVMLLMCWLLWHRSSQPLPKTLKYVLVVTRVPILNSRARRRFSVEAAGGQSWFDVGGALSIATREWSDRSSASELLRWWAKPLVLPPLSSPLQDVPPPVAQQRRRKIGSSLLQEFGRVCRVTVSAVPTVDHKNCLTSPLGDAPVGSKLIATSVSGESGSIELTLGIYATPDEFLDRARNLRHPFESFAVVPDLDKRKLREALTKGPEWIVATLTKWLQWACELEDTCKGFPLVGVEKPTGVFKRVRSEGVGEHSAEVSDKLCTFDLKNAYRQIALNPLSRAYSIVALLDPTSGDLGLFEGKALPFGSTASVLHFNRLSRLLWRVGLEVHPFWANFVDDYPVMSPECLSQSTMNTMMILSSVLGFGASLDKLNPFAGVATMLGVEVDLNEASAGCIHIRNKEGRASDVCSVIRDCIEVGHIMRDFAKVAGRVQFSDAQVMGRTTNATAIDLSRRAAPWAEPYRRRPADPPVLGVFFNTHGVSDREVRARKVTVNFFEQLQCTGQLIIKKGGQYNFFLSSDDGSKMWLNDKQVVDNDGCHGDRERGSSKAKYTAGAHKLVVDMCERGGGEVLKMRYKGPDTGNSKKAVPKSALRLPMQKCKGTLLDKPKDDVACDKIKDKSKCKDRYERVAQTDTYLQCAPTDASQEVNGLINCLAQAADHIAAMLSGFGAQCVRFASDQALKHYQAVTTGNGHGSFPSNPADEVLGSAVPFLGAAMASVGAKSDLLNVLGDVKARVQDKLGIVDFPMPQFILIGRQSVGKSRLIEALAGECFNFISGTLGSRRPTVLEFRHAPTFSQSRWFVRDRKTNHWVDHPVDQVMKIVGDAHEECGTSVSHEPIYVRIESSKCVDMQIVDLPGFRDFAIDTGKQDLADKIESLVMSFMKDKRNVMLCVEQAGDAATMSTLAKCRALDPDLKRTVLIRNKLDKYYSDLTPDNVSKWVDGFGDLPDSLVRFAMTLPWWPDTSPMPKPFNDIKDEKDTEDRNQMASKGLSDLYMGTIGFRSFVKYMEKKIEQMFADAIDPVLTNLKDLKSTASQQKRDLETEYNDTDPHRILSTTRDCGISFATALTHVMEGVLDLQPVMNLDEELRAFHTYHQTLGSAHFSMLPSEDFCSLNDYIDYLRNEIQIGAFDVEVNGGLWRDTKQPPILSPVM